jgi:hypothetical protein
MSIQLVIGPFIQAGESLSDAADCRAGQPVRFQVSTDNKMFNDLYNHLGEEVTVKVVPYSGVIVPPDYLRSVNFLKVRSGTHDAPVEQTELREFAIAIEYG